MKAGLIPRISFFSSEFTFSGKGSPPPCLLTRIAGASLLFFGLALAGPAAADPGIGPTSSASVGISVSVAPRYGLASGGSSTQSHQAATPGSYCIATNLSLAGLPVFVVRSGPDQREAVERLAGCEPGNSAVLRDAAQGLELLMVRPE